MSDDYYKTLGIGRDASDDDIKKAYRAKARESHPDLHPNDPAAKANFQKVQQAYDVLSDTDKRQKYNQFGPDFDKMGGFHPGGPSRGGGGCHRASAQEGNPFGDVDLGDIFRAFSGGAGPQGGAGGFGGSGGFEDLLRQATGGAAPGGQQHRSHRPHRQPPQNIEAEITIPFGTAIAGGKVDVPLPAESGSGGTITVTIPSGIEDGKKIRVRGKGVLSPDNQQGDLFLKVKVASHPFFSRIGKNLRLLLPISLREAALGAKVDIPSPLGTGTLTLSIPACSSSGDKLRLSGKGILFHATKKRKKETSDLIVELVVKLPKKFSKQEKEWLEKLDEKQGEKLRKKLTW